MCWARVVSLQTVPAERIFLPTIDRWIHEMPESTTLSAKYQISIPKSVRESQDWKPGQKFAFVPRGKGFVMVPVPTLEDLRGIAEGADSSDYRDREDRY
jgi:AbrB family looped-hinge helix DNA binding protein